MYTTSSKASRASFADYPDVMDINQVSELLGVSTKTVYKIIRDGTMSSMKVGRAFRVPKANIMRYMKMTVE